jgi:hypothetical protein
VVCHDRGDDLHELINRLLIYQLAGLIELLVGRAHGQVDLGDAGTGKGKRLARMILGPERAVVALARADHRRRLAVQRRLGTVWARAPVHQVFELTRHSGVALGGGEKQGVRLADATAHLLHDRPRVVLTVLIERRQ